MFNYKRIAVIGCSGAGKSTFSRVLAEKTGIPLYYLDMLYWKKDCTHLERIEFVKKQEEIINKSAWILDGNFRNTLELRIQSAELVFFFDIPTELCIDGVKKRGVRPDMPCVLPADEKLISAIKEFDLVCRPEILALLKKHRQCDVITFKSRAEADEYLAVL